MRPAARQHTTPGALVTTSCNTLWCYALEHPARARKSEGQGPETAVQWFPSWQATAPTATETPPQHQRNSSEGDQRQGPVLSDKHSLIVSRRSARPRDTPPEHRRNTKRRTEAAQPQTWAAKPMPRTTNGYAAPAPTARTEREARSQEPEISDNAPIIVASEAYCLGRASPEDPRAPRTGPTTATSRTRATRPHDATVNGQTSASTPRKRIEPANPGHSP